ncbi:LysR family transcriptional regulator [Eggerthella sinensis]|uniref:LysR family transcriptional regulator n=1 Tax=Eggerthella sinensis TaxID=242230 RepID=UPI001D0789BB|nr:LysR family transcriptional regulator [Eggerthella sinensis]MCB7037356.1 LysR family transcriptional regulator [Eggerthella sinensis]
MELHQLRYMAAVARCGSVAKASEELYVSKQAISKAIRSLEQEAGFELFDRGEHMRPTDAGRDILVHAERVLGEVDEIDRCMQARKAGAGAQETLAIAFKSFPLDYLFFHDGHEAVALINEFAARTPGCSVSTFKMSDTAVFNALEEGAIDLGFVHGAYKRPGIKLLPLGPVETRVITLHENPFCAKAPVRIADLEGVPIRSPFDFDLYTNSFIAACHERGFNPIFREVPLNDRAIDAFCAGGGVHLQPYDPLMEAAYPQSAFMPFHPSDRIELPLCLAYSEALAGPLALKLVSFIRNGLRR